MGQKKRMSRGLGIENDQWPDALAAQAEALGVAVRAFAQNTALSCVRESRATDEAVLKLPRTSTETGGARVRANQKFSAKLNAGEVDDIAGRPMDSTGASGIVTDEGV